MILKNENSEQQITSPMQKNKHCRHNLQQSQAKFKSGFILLPVVLTLTLVAAIAFLMNREGAMAVNELSSEKQSTQANLAATAGLNHMLWQANNADCTGYTNLNAVSLGTNSYSTTISPTSSSPVTITATGTDANGTSATIKRDRVKVYQPYKTAKLQLIPNTETPSCTVSSVDTRITECTVWGKDTLIASGNSTINFGASDNGVMKIWLFIWYYRNQLIQFDLPSSIPENPHIVSAELELYQTNGSGSGDISAHRITRNWVEGTKSGSGTADGATWKTYDGSNAWTANGGDYDPIPLATTTVTGSNNVTTRWDIAPLVEDWLATPTSNYGVLLRTEDSLSPTFAAKENTTAANRPKLVITYTCECGQPCTGCTPGVVGDNFTAIAYSGNNGSVNWTNSWQESGENNGANTGQLSVVSASQCTSGNCMKLSKNTTAVMSLTREAKLTQAQYAMLNFNYRRTIVSGSAGGSITLKISKDGGASFSNLKTYQLNVTDAFSISESINISDYMAAKTQVRFEIDSGSSFQTNIHVDDIAINASCTPPPVAILSAAADVDIYAGTPSTNYGTDKNIVVGKDITGKDDKILIKFDLTSLPTGAIITSATLRLNLVGSSDTGAYNIGLYKIIKPWGETTATWSNFSSGGNYDSTQQAVTNVTLGNFGFKEWGLPISLINGWMTTPTSNYGLALVYESSTKGPDYQFASKEYTTDLSARPQLVINYTMP